MTVDRNDFPSERLCLSSRPERKVQLLLIAITSIAVPLSFVDAPFPEELFLQHVGTLSGLVCLAGVVSVAGTTKLSYYCVLTFVWLHIIGARWIYSFVPYDDVALYLFGMSLSDYFDWKRNHYDRLVHFASGVLGVAPASELLQRLGGMRPLGAALMGIACVMTAGAVYEILEWQIAIIFSPAQAEAYNGQQGNIWDPQKDLALAWLGAMISAGMIFRWSPTASPRIDDAP